MTCCKKCAEKVRQASMIRIAKWSARGPFAGNIQILRAITGRQQWTVKIRIRNGAEQDEHEIRSAAPVDLSAIAKLVFDSINEMLPPGGTVNDAEMEFFIKGKG